jgi:hypothetical protein
MCTVTVTISVPCKFATGLEWFEEMLPMGDASQFCYQVSDKIFRISFVQMNSSSSGEDDELVEISCASDDEETNRAALSQLHHMQQFGGVTSMMGT